MIDTASDTGPWYKTESLIGEILVEKKVKRRDFFLTSKLHPQDFGDVRGSFERTLKNLKTSYLDLYIMHYPRCYPSLCPKDHKIHFLTVWEEMEKLYDESKVRAIGISNFDASDIKLLHRESRVRPHVIQSHADPLKQNREVIELSLIYGISYQSYSPLGSQWVMKLKKNPVLSEPVLVELAKKYNKSVAQIVLRWNVQEGMLVIPKSRNPQHIKENLEIFDFSLTHEEMTMIRNLDGKIRF